MRKSFRSKIFQFSGAGVSSVRFQQTWWTKVDLCMEFFFFLFGVLAALGIRDTAYGSRDVTNYVGKKNQEQQACIVTVAYDLKWAVEARAWGSCLGLFRNKEYLKDVAINCTVCCLEQYSTRVFVIINIRD